MILLRITGAVELRFLNSPSVATLCAKCSSLAAMSLDVVDLRNFYSEKLGVVARRFVRSGIRALWHDTTGPRVLGHCYNTPFLCLVCEETGGFLAFIPASQGVVKWPSAKPTLASLVDP